MSAHDSRTATSAHSGATRPGAYGYALWLWSLFLLVLSGFTLVTFFTRNTTWNRRLARRLARLLFRLAGMPIEVLHLDRLPRRQHIVLVNHTSFLDAIVLTALLPPCYSFTTRQQFRMQRLLCPPLRHLHTLVLGQLEAAHVSGTDALKTALAGGENLVIFPEGRIVRKPGLQPFHAGAFVAAATTGTPMVVAGLRGAREALPLGSWRPRRLPISLEIGTVILPASSDTGAVHDMMRRAHQAMAMLTGESASQQESAR